MIFHITSIDIGEVLCKISLLDHENKEISTGNINSEGTFKVCHPRCVCN